MFLITYKLTMSRTEMNFVKIHHNYPESKHRQFRHMYEQTHARQI